MYLILLDAILNDIVSLIFFSLSSLLIFMNAIYFCILIFSPATLLKININSKTVFGENFYIFAQCIMSSSNNYNLTQSFLIYPFYFFFCLTVLANILRTVSNRCASSKQSCLVIDFRLKALRFSSFF